MRVWLPIFVVISIVLVGVIGDMLRQPAYSERRFDQIRIGMPIESVLAKLGEPVEKRGWRKGTWIYKQPAETSGECRMIIFKDGAVTLKIRKVIERTPNADPR